MIAIASSIKADDPTSTLARANLADAYKAKGETEKAIQEQLDLYRIDPTNTGLVRDIIIGLANSGAPEKALPIIDSLLVNNPGDPEMLGTKWKLQLAAAEKGNRDMYKRALVSGEEYVKADTAAGNLEYYQRQIGAAQKDSNQAGVIQMANKAAMKFPKDVTFQLLIARGNLQAGQLQPALAAARKAMEADPKSLAAVQIAMAAFNQMNMPDSTVAIAQKAIAAGVSKDELGQQLLAVAAPAIRKAQESKSRADWEESYKAFQQVDAIASTAQSSLYLGISAFSIAADALNNANTLHKSAKKEDKAKACEELKVADDMFTIAQQMVPKGGKADATTAGQIMQGLTTYMPYVPQLKKQFACK